MGLTSVPLASLQINGLQSSARLVKTITSLLLLQLLHPRRQVPAGLRVLQPELVLRQHVLGAELAALPVEALLLPAEVAADVLVAVLELEGQAALLALRVLVGVVALVEQVVGELPDVDEAPALLAVDQHLALTQVVLLDVQDRLQAVLAHLLPTLPLPLPRLPRLLVDRLLAVGELHLLVVPAALGLLHPHRLLARLRPLPPLLAVELLLEFGVVEAEFGVFLLNLGVVDAVVHHVEHALHHLRTGVLDYPDHLLVADQVGEGHQQVGGLALHPLVGVLEVPQHPPHHLLLRELLLAVPLQQRAHQLQLGYDQLGVVLDVVLVPDESLGDAAQPQEGDLGQPEVGGVGQLLDLPVGVVEEVEQLVEDVLHEEGHVLQGEAHLGVGQPVDEADGFQGDGRVLGHDHPRQQLDGAHQLLLALDAPLPLPHEPQRLLLRPPVLALAQLPHPLGDEPEVPLDTHPQLVLQRQQLVTPLSYRLTTNLQLLELVQVLLYRGVVHLHGRLSDRRLVHLQGQLALLVGLKRQVLGGLVLVEQRGHDLLVEAGGGVLDGVGLGGLELGHLDGTGLGLGVIEGGRVPLHDQEAVLGVELLLVLEELFPLELHHLPLLGDLELDAVAAVVVLHSQRLLLLTLQPVYLQLQLLEVGQHLLEVRRLLVVLPLSRRQLLLLQLLVDRPEERRGLGLRLVPGGRFLGLERPGVVTDLEGLGHLVLAAVLQVDALDLLAAEYLPEDNEVLNGHLVEDIAFVLVVLMQQQADVGAGELEVEALLLLLLEGGLRVVVGEHVAQLLVALPRPQTHVDLQDHGDLVLVEEDVELLGADGHVELDGDALRVGRVYCRLPPLLPSCQVRCRVTGVLAGGAVDAELDLAHNSNFYIDGLQQASSCTGISDNSPDKTRRGSRARRKGQWQCAGAWSRRQRQARKRWLRP